ncbi:preprotein translocase subunit SecY [Jonesia denitrificans]|uniref:Protein translocase subunit SecY n=1 Tax=Jonesia denitrificans (strain ATCC 14870 / DSM 20603 / BCRC 15368 / CIP 55.134 / JCM 11481 / NBRC 15587 / NCTC 10816 / Prevot 55134) TaxID=471856 RepID=C7R0W4_JONDD|nr:preprotein translocase subunit SecY [Jonesia denitrificans]ACV08271.1 preprotein translocase, SecY subunit [Jonesia denitrificans DSM 20603]ASE08061.1 preprotein translocase subunit SecY [Jonesia denitrificans]QXB42665.1 preprotein translocase subunit SecY [Jonesia denitrificans]SQH20252.1 preprotein translocase subunit SecY [Jonesia denitrificans]
MLGGFVRAFRTPDLRYKLLFTIGIIVLYRIGSFVPAPGVSYPNIQQCLATQETGALLGLVNLFSGGALLQLSIFALGIMPYITASIIVQLLRVVIPRFEALHKEGQTGTAKLTQYTRYLTIGLALLQATTYVTLARTGNLIPGCVVIPNNSVMTSLFVVLTMTAGATLLMWFGEQITDRGIGNGMSMLIFISIAASFPPAIWSITQGSGGFAKFAIVLAVALIVIALVVFVEQSQRRIPVQYAKRMVGRKVYGGSSTYIPIKINMAGVIPVIFASSILAVPTLVAQFADVNNDWVAWIQRNIASPSAPLHLALFVVMILFFCFFYTAITFNPDEVADNMKKYGGFIPGIRAGRPTAEYLDYVITRVTSAGAIYLALVALVPTVTFIAMGVGDSIPFGGTSILIIVGVGLETVKQIDSQLQQRHYEGLLK